MSSSEIIVKSPNEDKWLKALKRNEDIATAKALGGKTQEEKLKDATKAIKQHQALHPKEKFEGKILKEPSAATREVGRVAIQAISG